MRRESLRRAPPPGAGSRPCARPARAREPRAARTRAGTSGCGVHELIRLVHVGDRTSREREDGDGDSEHECGRDHHWVVREINIY